MVIKNLLAMRYVFHSCFLFYKKYIYLKIRGRVFRRGRTNL